MNCDTVNEVLRQVVEKHSHRDALIFFGNRITYGLLWRQVNLFSLGLRRLGVRSGDRVAIMLPNCPQSVIAYFAVLNLNAIVVQFNTQYIGSEIKQQFSDCQPKVFIVWDGFSERLPMEVSFGSQIIVASADEYLPFPLNYLYRLKKWRSKFRVPVRDYSCFKELLRFYPGECYTLTDSRPEDVAVLQYTGGTTAASKGAVLTHGNLVANILQTNEWFSQFERGRSVMLVAAPLFHSFAMTVCQNLMIFRGDTIVLVPDPRNLNQLLKVVEKYRPTIFPGPPRLLGAFADKARGRKINFIKYGISGSAPLPKKVLQDFEEATGAVLAEGYGLSETSPATHCNPLHWSGRRAGSIGLLMPRTEAKIVNEEGKEVPEGEVGELIIHGPQVMRGYWNKPEETAQALRTIDGKIWFFTGDAVKKDNSGYFCIVDRFKDMIIKNGEKVYSLEVEQVLTQNSLVQEAAVIGKKNERGKEEVIAFIILKDWPTEVIDDPANEGFEALKETIKDFCRDKLTAYKIPDKIIFTKEIPKTALLKTDKKKLREMV